MIQRYECPVCGCDGVEIFSEPYDDILPWLESYYGHWNYPLYGDYELDWCRNCGMYWQPRILDDAGTEYLYSNSTHTAQTAERSLEKKTDVDYSNELKLVKKLVKGDAVLDFGCGWGHWCKQAQDRGLSPVGVDICKEKREYAQELGVLVFPTLPDLRFDFINCEQVMEHLPDPLSTLRDLKSHLNPGGVIRIAVPNAKYLSRYLEEFPAKGPIQPLEHINAFTNPSLERLGREAGMKPITIFKPKQLYQRFFGTKLYFR